MSEADTRMTDKPKLPRFRAIDVVGEPKRTLSSFVKGYTDLPVQVHNR